MKSLLQEYIDKKLSITDLHKELHQLIEDYETSTGRFLFIYSADFDKGNSKNVNISLTQDDFYIIQDLLRNYTCKKIDFYIESPGGSGESAEEIAKFLHNKFSEVNFIIASEAKSAGTILALSGHNISMTDSGSLGPIDAQVRIGRSVVSAYDYYEWIKEKKIEAAKNRGLNPVDAVIISQVSPGEIKRIINSLEFAKDLVSDWLVKYKFKDWTKTETNGITVDAEYKMKRAKKVAEELTNQSKLRTHGRSLKIEDLREWLKIDRIDDNKDLAEIVYKIKTVIRLIYASSSTYKLFFTDTQKIFRNQVAQGATSIPFPIGNNIKNQKIEAKIEQKCPKCAKVHTLKAIPVDQLSESELKLNDIEDLVCDSCGFNVNLNPVRNQLELQLNRKVKILNN
ncbi:MAG: SDH family Clp fold serine proteinase [Lutibacter sp.]